MVLLVIIGIVVLLAWLAAMGGLALLARSQEKHLH